MFNFFSKVLISGSVAFFAETSVLKVKFRDFLIRVVSIHTHTSVLKWKLCLPNVSSTYVRSFSYIISKRVIEIALIELRRSLWIARAWKLVWSVQLTISVTKWLDYLSNIWPITAMKICPIAYFFAKVGSNFCNH